MRKGEREKDEAISHPLSLAYQPSKPHITSVLLAHVCDNN
jgi:hypothetical protein